MADDCDERSLLVRLANSFGELGTDLAGHRKPDEALALVTGRAVAVVPGAQDAAVTRGRPGNFQTVAATSDRPLQVDQIQYQLGSGPCVDAVIQDRVFRTGDLGSDPRWPEFGRLAVQRVGVHSMLSFRIFLEDNDLIAAINLYSTDRDAFSIESEQTALLLATHSVALLTNSRQQKKIENLERALASSREIGVAIGILMATHRLTEGQAFDLLRVASQRHQRRLADIARDVTYTGTLSLD